MDNENDAYENDLNDDFNDNQIPAQYVQVVPGDKLADVESLANQYDMEVNGVVTYDDGSPIDEQTNNTILYYDNTDESKSDLFLEALHDEYPDLNAEYTDDKDDSDSLDMDRVELNYEGLDTSQEQTQANEDEQTL